ncbi:MAG: ACT domain-containing protein, partial [Armatimonadota bacterium]
LGHITDTGLNYINAPAAARERGIEVAQARTESSGGYSHWLEVTLHSERADTSVAGALFENAHGRIVRVNDYRLELVPRQTLLLLWNADPKTPGFVGQIGALLGEAGINITGIQVASNEVDGVGLMAATVAASIPAEVIEQMRDLPGVVRVETADMETQNSTAE